MIDTPAIEKLLGELEALHEKATPGPWDVWLEHITCPEDAINELVCQVENTDPIASALVLLNAGGKCPAITGCGPTSEANGELIAATVSALPTLITTIRALMEAVEDGRRELSRATGRQRISIVDQHGSEVGHRHASMKELLTEEAFVDEDGVAWTIPTAWAYRQACLAIRSKGDA